MFKPFQHGREEQIRRFGGLPDTYAGPQEFMEPGARGFIVTTVPGKEEFALDDAIDLLRQASIKLYGGIKPRPKELNTIKGFVKIDFMDPEAVTVLPHPDGDDKEIESSVTSDPAQKVEKCEQPTEKGTDLEAGKAEAEDSVVKDEQGKEKDVDSVKTEGVDEETGIDTEEGKEIEAEKKNNGDMEEEKKEEKDEDSKSGEDKAGDEKMIVEEKKGDDKKDTAVPLTENEKKKEIKVEPKKELLNMMRCTHKFKAFRTEKPNIMFIKSDIPDPLELATAVMEMVLERKSISGDSILQLMPVHGVCNNDSFQLEIMSRRVLSSIFDENLPVKSFSILLVDKLSEASSDMQIEIVRNSIWSINPCAWLASPLTEPDAVVKLELMGTKLVLCCMSSFMRYRQYSPHLLVSLGSGEPEDDDGTDISTELRKEWDMRKERKRKIEEEEKKKREEKRFRRDNYSKVVDKAQDKKADNDTSNENKDQNNPAVTCTDVQKEEEKSMENKNETAEDMEGEVKDTEKKEAIENSQPENVENTEISHDMESTEKVESTENIEEDLTSSLAKKMEEAADVEMASDEQEGAEEKSKTPTKGKGKKARRTSGARKSKR